jgi:Family of unknown function (DUF6083)
VRDLEAQDGARWLPEDDPDSYLPYEPVPCAGCGAQLRWYPTNYDRWIALESREQPAKNVPDGFRWRLYQDLRSGSTAMRVVGHSLPDDLVLPAHQAFCPARLADEENPDVGDLYRRRRHRPHDG